MPEATTTATAPRVAPTDAKASGKAISKSLGLVRANGDKLNKLIHETAMSAALHAQAFGDVQYCQALVMACPASMRRSMLIAWFGKYTPVVVKDSADWTAKQHKKDSKLYVAYDLVGGDAEPFYVIAEKNPEKTYDFKALVAMVERLAKTIEKKIEDGKVPEEDVESAKAVAQRLEGLSFQRVMNTEFKPGTETISVSDKPIDNKGPEEQHEEPLVETLGVELKVA